MCNPMKNDGNLHLLTWHGITFTSMATSTLCGTKPSHSDKKRNVFIFTICSAVVSSIFHTE